MTLIGLSGKAKSGKDTVADRCCELYGWRKMKLADPLKHMCREMFGLTTEHTDGAWKADPVGTTTPRQLMIEIGRLGRAVSERFWIERLQKQILQHPQAQLGTFIVADVRFKNEAEWIKKYGGFLVRLERAVELRGDDILDPSETDLDDYEGFDLKIGESWNVDARDVPAIAARIKEGMETKRASPFFNR
jgi:hypothetical protein